MLSLLFPFSPVGKASQKNRRFPPQLGNIVQKQWFQGFTEGADSC